MSSSENKPEAKKIDWERIEIEYRAGLLSVREIAKSHGITHGAINKRCKRDGWVKDLQAKIKAKADELVSKREVSALVSKEVATSERILIESNASVIADIRMAHRTDIKRARLLAMELMMELESQTINAQLFEEFGELMRKENKDGIDRMNDLYHKIISGAGRIDGMKKLSDTIKNLIGLEREAYGLSTIEAPTQAVINNNFSQSPEEYEQRAAKLLKEV